MQVPVQVRKRVPSEVEMGFCLVQWVREAEYFAAVFPRLV
jgi:hypothetical protein